MGVFLQTVLPVISIFFIGYILQKWLKLDVKSVSSVALYVMLPCLVFQTFYESELNEQYIKMVVFSAILLLAIIMINKILKWILKLDLTDESSLVLGTAFMNAGNYGAPIILFAFGEEGFVYSVSFLVLQAIIMNFFGVYYAARGTKGGMVKAVYSVLKMPPTYALMIVMFVKFFDIRMPDAVMSPVDLLASALVPMVMVVLGMQLANIKFEKLEWWKVSYATVVRLFLSPLIAFIIVSFIDMEPLLAKVLIVSSAMPSAATTTMYAVEFNTKPDLVSSITLVTTIMSVFTISVLLLIV
ncbi:AEC family transporter [Aquisalibacillus elongatus]|uniref:Transporter n=1 Tax=Aquisalibacillus elongatus TaxID=485577 RepID=A0A3N5BBK7_9BACI|nr:AEC family transporter [Aquisalibacillus elongatus]RPF54319.1 hypothetical protein EDC24_1516 [Aquisalibacillus elongatus]